jgi:hypothetical protein
MQRDGNTILNQNCFNIYVLYYCKLYRELFNSFSVNRPRKFFAYELLNVMPMTMESTFPLTLHFATSCLDKNLNFYFLEMKECMNYKF